jgi:hypothetical protein
VTCVRGSDATWRGSARGSFEGQCQLNGYLHGDYLQHTSGSGKRVRINTQLQPPTGSMRSATKMLVCGVKIAWQKWNVPTGGAPRRSAIAKKKKNRHSLARERTTPRASSCARYVSKRSPAPATCGTNERHSLHDLHGAVGILRFSVIRRYRRIHALYRSSPYVWELRDATATRPTCRYFDQSFANAAAKTGEIPQRRHASNSPPYAWVDWKDVAPWAR